MSTTTTQLLSSGEFCKLRYDTVPVKSASANVSFYASNTKMPNFELWQSCRKWAISLCLIHYGDNFAFHRMLQMQKRSLFRAWQHTDAFCSDNGGRESHKKNGDFKYEALP